MALEDWKSHVEATIKSLKWIEETACNEFDDDQSIQISEKFQNIYLLLEEAVDIAEGIPDLCIPKVPEGDFVWTPIKEDGNES